MPDDTDLIPPDAPPEVHARARRPARVPSFDPTLGRPVAGSPQDELRHRLVAIGDSLTQGFQSGAVFGTDLSFPAIIALDGVHPTTVGYGLIAQQAIDIMRLAGVRFRHPTGSMRPDPVTVGVARLIARDTLIRHPPQNLSSTSSTLGWADETLDWVRRALSFGG